MTDPLRIDSIEVVRLGRLQWHIVKRYAGGHYMVHDSPYLFRWTAIRRARRDAARAAGPGEVVVARFEIGRKP